MAKFRFTMNVEPEDIPNLDDSHKRDCADLLTSIINNVFKFNLILSIGTLAFFAAFSLFSFTYCLRMGKLLPQLPTPMPFVGLAILLLSFTLGLMSKPAIILEALLCGALILISMLNIQTIWIMPFAMYTMIINLKLFTLVPIHRAISAEQGYPEFTPLPTKDDIVIRPKAEETDASK